MTNWKEINHTLKRLWDSSDILEKKPYDPESGASHLIQLVHHYQNKSAMAMATNRWTKLDDFTPQVIEDRYLLVLIEPQVCNVCGSKMILPLGIHDGLFPRYYRITLEAQMNRAGIHIQGIHPADPDADICTACLRNGKATFRCSFCSQHYTTDQLNKDFEHEYDEEHMCMSCKESISLSHYQKIIKEMEKRHRYDYDYGD